MMHLKLLSLSALFILFLTGTAIAGKNAPVVLFDAAHGEKFLPQEESPLALTRLSDLFVAAGFTIRSNKEPLTAARLTDVDAVVISGPFLPLTVEEIEILYNFVQRGGHLAVMLHVAPISANLLARFSVFHSNGVIREAEHAQIDGDAMNFQVINLGKEPLFRGVNHFAVYGCWALAAEGDAAQIVAASSNQAWIDLDNDRSFSMHDARQSFGVIALGEIGQGNFVIFGDDAIFQNHFLVGGNLHLAKNLVDRLIP